MAAAWTRDSGRLVREGDAVVVEQASEHRVLLHEPWLAFLDGDARRCGLSDRLTRLISSLGTHWTWDSSQERIDTTRYYNDLYKVFARDKLYVLIRLSRKSSVHLIRLCALPPHTG